MKQRRKAQLQERDHESEHEIMMDKVNKLMPMAKRQTRFKDESVPLVDEETGRKYIDQYVEPEEDATVVDIVVAKR